MPPVSVASPQAPPRAWNPLALAALAAAWSVTACNWPLWRALAGLPELASFRGALFMAGFGLMICALAVILMAPFAWQRAVKPAIAVFLTSAALGAHFMGSYGLVIDPALAASVLQTDLAEARDLADSRLLASTALLLAPLPWILRRHVARELLLRQLVRNVLGVLGASALLATLAFAFFADLSSTMRNHKSLRYLVNPMNSFYAIAVHSLGGHAHAKGPVQPIGLDARVTLRATAERPPLLVLVVGETARADHFSLNGYPRPTNPRLAELGLISFREVSACGTDTASALPCMFSHLGRKGYLARAQEHENLLDLAQRAGLAVLWLDNQSGCKGVCDRVPHAHAREAAPGATAPPAALCPGGECFDEALLHGLDARLAALPAERRARGILLVMHQMGSHGPAYFKRAPEERKPFQPECRSAALQRCEREALVNAYDNSIAYADHVLARLAEWLERQRRDYDPALLYVSDHGESLGENNLYLHGMPYALAPREQKHVPMLAWIPPQTEAAHGLSSRCLQGWRDAPFSHDHLFHTTLGLLGVEAAEYLRGLDAFAPCRTD